ncbi:transcriptional regulator, BadM/Rrf2 family [Marininema mesophilum]|uniref:Transcriptional regulator, BadM/Rrf2 family n=1 Tax=Marininema mesophilum TaxID=1048340 RepID=A0A1H2ZFZ7_9BACL|nr:Rrf2 family transcriptional regulator [Marininema mesophilum]SDX16412.1 transcriptional regulator, BadM/Rrf2 family [Marininema mesophilum]
MKISSRGEYALRALIVLGLQEERVLSIAEVSAKTLVPLSYLEQILLQLKMLGYVKSKRGKYGGYRLSQDPDEIVIGQVIRRLEGPLAPMGCVSVTAYESCPLEEGCLLKPLWALIRDVVADLLDHTTLSHLLNNQLPPLKKPVHPG